MEVPIEKVHYTVELLCSYLNVRQVNQRDSPENTRLINESKTDPRRVICVKTSNSNNNRSANDHLTERIPSGGTLANQIHLPT